MLTFFKRFLTKILHLQWKLTFSYILVTAIGLIVTIVVAILVLVQCVINQYQQNASDALQEQAQPVLDQLEHPASHQSLIDELLAVDSLPQHISLDLGVGSDAVVVSIPTQRGYTIVLDPHGRIVASSDPKAMPEGGLLSTKWSADGMRVVHKANMSNVDSQPIVFVNHQQRLYAAIPLFNRYRERLGVLLTTQVVLNWSQIVIVLFQLFGPTFVLITCIVSIIGSLFGFVASRWLVRRFMKVIQATKSWSQGEFSPIMADRPDDEFSVITRLLTKCYHLQWKLTSSYILITAVGLMTAIVVTILVLVQFEYPQHTSRALQTAAPHVLNLLEDCLLRPPFGAASQAKCIQDDTISSSSSRAPSIEISSRTIQLQETSSAISGPLDGPFQTASQTVTWSDIVQTMPIALPNQPFDNHDPLINELLSINSDDSLGHDTGATVFITHKH